MAGEPYFIWKGVDSRLMRVWVQKYPSITRPPERYQEVTIPGRPGSLTLLEGVDVYEPYVREMRIMPKPGADIYEIMRWLKGKGEVVFGCEPDRKQVARIYDEASFERVFADQRSATVRFLCDPFKMALAGDKQITIPVSPATYTLTNPGDVVAYPLVVVSGSGGVAVTINGTRTVITGVLSTATIDCESGSVVADGSNVRTYGDCGSLAVGDNTLTWEGTVTGLTVTPRWRWL